MNPLIFTIGFIWNAAGVNVVLLPPSEDEGWKESLITTKIATGKLKDFKIMCIHSYIVSGPEITDGRWKSSLMKDESFLLG